MITILLRPCYISVLINPTKLYLFFRQQKKLGTIDEAIEKLVLKMQNLLTKLETMENVKKLKQ